MISVHNTLPWYQKRYLSMMSHYDIMYDTVQMISYMIQYKCEIAHLEGRWRLSDGRCFACPGGWFLHKAPISHSRKSRACWHRLGGRGSVNARHRQARPSAERHAPLDNAASSRNKEWSRSMIGAQSSISKTSFFTLMVSSSISLLWTKSEKTTSTSWPRWLFTQWAWHDRNLLTILISAFGSASRSWLHMAHSHQCWSAWWRNKQWAGDICWLQKNAIWTRIEEHQIMGGRSLLIVE